MQPTELEALAARYGTPCFVFDEDAFCARMREAQQIVGDSVRLCYSIKANPFLVPAVTPLVALLEVCSPGELEICRALNVPPQKILLSGVTKTLADIERALDLGMTQFTAESPLHVTLLQQAANARGIVVPVLLRLSAGTQFGMDESDLRAIIAGRDAYTALRIEGIHYFAGTQRKKLTEQRAELAMLDRLCDQLAEDFGFTAARIEYGPGLYFPYFVHEAETDTLAPLRELADDLRALAARCALTVEMGRFFASPCGVYLTRVLDVKTTAGTHYALVDGGIHHVNYLGGTMGMRVPHIVHLPCAAHEPCEMTDYALCGSLCTTADVLVRRAPFPGLTPGDVLAFERIGAYAVTEAPALFLSRDMPRVVLRRADGCVLARDTLHSYALNLPDAARP